MDNNIEQEKIRDLLDLSKAHWKALDWTMDFFSSYIEKVEVSRKPTLQYLIGCLQTFANTQFFFFLDGFGNYVEGYTPEKFATLKLERPQPSDAFPLPYIFRVTLNQIAYDIDVIQRAAGQRLSALASNIVSATLEDADKLAQKALQPLIDINWLPKETTAVTYFQKSASIRVIPYAPVALIAIPYNANLIKRDYLALYHELGHYIYWRGKVDGKPVREEIMESINKQSQPDTPLNKILTRWAEEIFADIYGCLVAGPVLALDFQDLELKSSKAEFVEDDGKHAVSFLRPYIYTEVLKKMNLARWSEVLENHWTTKRKERIEDPDPVFIPYGPWPDSPPKINLASARSFVNTIIDNAFALLPDDFEGFVKWTGTSDLEVADTTIAEDKIGKLYQDFETIHFNELVSGSLRPDLWPPEPDPTYWDKWVTQVGGVDEDGKSVLSKDLVKEGNLKEKPAGTWIHILAAAGWTTGGPSSHD